MVACFMKRMRGPIDSQCAEVMGIKWEVRWTKKIEIVGGIFEIDNLEVVQGVNALPTANHFLKTYI